MNNLNSVRGGIQSALEEATSKLREQRSRIEGASVYEHTRSRVIGNQVRGIGLRDTPAVDPKVRPR